MSSNKISIAQDFTPTPGVRYIEDEPNGAKNSGERFREHILVDALNQAIADGTKLEIDFDGVRAMGPSFIDEAFGVLVGKWKLAGKDVQKLRKTIVIRSESLRTFKLFAEERMDFWQNLSVNQIELDFKKIDKDRAQNKTK